jgi:preprotein translocase subunit YajC
MATDNSSLIMIGLFVVMIVAFYFLMMRPQRKRQQEHQAMMAELKLGERIVTIGGVYGQIESLADDSVVIKVESGASLRILRQAVAYKQGDVPAK